MRSDAGTHRETCMNQCRSKMNDGVCDEDGRLKPENHGVYKEYMVVAQRDLAVTGHCVRSWYGLLC